MKEIKPTIESLLTKIDDLEKRIKVLENTRVIIQPYGYPIQTPNYPPNTVPHWQPYTQPICGGNSINNVQPCGC